MPSSTPTYNHAMNNSCKMLSLTPTWKASNELHLKHVTSKSIGERSLSVMSKNKSNGDKHD